MSKQRFKSHIGFAGGLLTLLMTSAAFGQAPPMPIQPGQPIPGLPGGSMAQEEAPPPVNPASLLDPAEREWREQEDRILRSLTLLELQIRETELRNTLTELRQAQGQEEARRQAEREAQARIVEEQLRRRAAEAEAERAARRAAQERAAAQEAGEEIPEPEPEPPPPIHELISAPDWNLLSTYVAGGRRTAAMRGAPGRILVRVGDTLPDGWQIEEIENTYVVLRRQEGPDLQGPLRWVSQRVDFHSSDAPLLLNDLATPSGASTQGMSSMMPPPVTAPTR